MRTWPAVAVLLLAAVPARAQSNVAATRHNLSSSGAGPIRSPSEPEICVFCHTPHAARPVEPLWGHDTSATTYQMYTSTSFTAAASGPYLPSGSSRLCLSCHDGTVALGALVSRTVSVSGTAGGRMPAGASNLTTNLRDDHPVSFPYVATTASDADFRTPPTAPVTLEQGRVECTSCHDAHITATDFLRATKTNGTLCIACHAEANWGASTHATSTRIVTAGTTVAQLACDGCHASHSAARPSRLLDRDSTERVCYRCHGTGSTVATDIQTSALRLYAHRLHAYESQHEPVTVSPPLESSPISVKHVECSDCHDGHQVSPSGASGRLQGVMGVNTSGTPVRLGASDPEYYLCFRCHAFGGEVVTATGDDKYVHFGTSAPASSFIDGTTLRKGFHPVVQAGRGATNLNWSNLLAGGLTAASLIRCSDCHASQALAGDSGLVNRTTAGVEGPHGSTTNYMLRGNYTINPCLAVVNSNCAPYNSPTGTAFSLCFACHRVTMWTAGGSQWSNFGSSGQLHPKHADESGCPECHWDMHSNAHGTSHTDYVNIPTTRTSSAMVNFAPSVAGNGFAKPRWFYDTSRSRYACTLSCHGKNHSNESY